MTKVWLITGSGAGLGRSIAIKALENGDRIVATARDISQLQGLSTLYGDRVSIARLDVVNEEEAKEAVAQAISVFGRLDVLVNNAGYGDARPFEEASSADFRRVIETNFFGVANLCRAALPGMRQQKSGHIIQISSVGGRFATAGNAAYHAAKWAVGGFTEALAFEVASFGVKVTALEPGGMRTNWGKRAFSQKPSMLPEYESTVGALFDQLAGYWGNEAGDPEKIAEFVMKVAAAGRLPPHIVLGADAMKAARHFDAERNAASDRWEKVSAWTDVGSEGPMPALPAE